MNWMALAMSPTTPPNDAIAEACPKGGMDAGRSRPSEDSLTDNDAFCETGRQLTSPPTADGWLHSSIRYLIHRVLADKPGLEQLRV